MSRRKADPTIDLFLDEPTRDLEHWAWLWAGDHPFPIRGRGGILGRLAAVVKRLLRPMLKAVLGDLWDRQRTWNLIVLETLVNDQARYDHRFREHQDAIEAHARLLEALDRRSADALTDVLRHNDALFARVDQKLDLYRREAKDLWHRLGALIAAGEPAAGAARRVQREQEYLELERRFRGSEEDIAERVAVYLPHLEGISGPVLDLGCGRGEALSVFAAHGHAVRGVDANREMVELCRQKGHPVSEGDLLEALAAAEEGSLGAVVSFHVVEHLATDAVERLVRLAWRALEPGGRLILETPNPLSIVMSARQFWIDPTHRRPVHPASLELTYREAGFEPVHRIDLHPFPADDRLPEIDLREVPEAQRALADQVNRLRDLLDDLLFGSRDFGMVGFKGS